MVATQKQWETTLIERRSEVPFGAVTYGPIFKALGIALRNPARTEEVLEQLRNPQGVAPRVHAFRRNAAPHAEWFFDEVAPKVKRVVRKLEGFRPSKNPEFVIDGSAISGGPHWLVQWDDNTTRLLYVVGPGWSRRRVLATLVLLQMYAVTVQRMHPRTVVVVDLHRHEVLELRDRDPSGEIHAVKTVRTLRHWLRTRKGAS